MRVIAAIVLLISSAVAATTVAETTMRAPGGRPAQGYFTIAPSAPCTGASGVMVVQQANVPIVNGRFSVALEPNDTCIPANTRYLVEWHLDAVMKWNEVWNVPTTGATLHRNDVFTTYIAPTNTVALSQLTQGGATVGQAPCWSGSSWVPGSCGGGGISWTVNTVAFSATPTFDLSAGNIQKITLTGNVTAASITGITSSTVMMFEICQDATGGRTFAWPAAAKGAMTVGTAAGKCSWQWFASTDGVSLYSQGLGVINQ